MSSLSFIVFFFFFNDTATTEIYTLSLHDALPIWVRMDLQLHPVRQSGRARQSRESHGFLGVHCAAGRSEEHTSELQSRLHLVCRLLLEKKKKDITPPAPHKPNVPAAVTPRRRALT